MGVAILVSSVIGLNPVEAQSRNGWYKVGSNLGDTASVFVDLERGQAIHINDGDPSLTVSGGNFISGGTARKDSPLYEWLSYPIKGGAYGEQETVDLSDKQLRSHAQRHYTSDKKYRNYD